MWPADCDGHLLDEQPHRFLPQALIAATTPRMNQTFVNIARIACVVLGMLTAQASAQQSVASYEGPDPALELSAARRFDAIRNDPVALRMRLRAMPKGGDLHNHLTGAIYAESYLRWAAEDGVCIDPVALRLVPAVAGACAVDLVPAAQASHDIALYRRMVDAASMRNFVAGAPLRGGLANASALQAGDASGHDHFFSAFDKVRGARQGRAADMLAEVANRAADEGVSYLELMVSPGMSQMHGLAGSPGESYEQQWVRYEALAAPVVEQVTAVSRADEAGMREKLGCASPSPQPGCSVTIRYLSEVNRTRSVDEVFAQGVLAHRLGAADPRFVGFNLVGPEDSPQALADYRNQMTVLAWLHQRNPDFPLALHAGELVEGLVPPEHLLFHIREAVQVAGARRIGHGVDLAYERDALALLQLMARKQVAVEINLSSNDLILGVKGKRHPLGAFLKAGVPIVLSTDDPGIARITLTHEFAKAVEEQALDYVTLKTAVRNSLEFAFVEGASLWTGGGAQPRRIVPACRDLDSPSCVRHVAGSTRARLQAELERALIAFERAMP